MQRSKPRRLVRGNRRLLAAVGDNAFDMQGAQLTSQVAASTAQTAPVPELGGGSCDSDRRVRCVGRRTRR